MKHLITIATLLAGISLFAGTPESPKEVDPLQVGTSIPDVTLTDLEGEPVNLKERLSGKSSVLVFYRGSWCPYCNRHLSSLMDIEEDLKELRYELIALSPDKPEGLKEAIEKNDLSYTLLSDSSADAAKAFGLAFKVDAATRKLYRGYGIDLEEASGETHHILPIPAVYVVDKEGIIQYVYTNPDYKVRLSAEEVLEAAKNH